MRFTATTNTGRTYQLPLTPADIAADMVKTGHSAAKTGAQGIVRLTADKDTPLSRVLSDIIEWTAETASPTRLDFANYAATLISAIADDDRLSLYARLACAALEDAPFFTVETVGDVIQLCHELRGEAWTPLVTSDPGDTADRLNAIVQASGNPKRLSFMTTGDDDYPVIAYDGSYEAPRGIEKGMDIAGILIGKDE